MWWLTRSLAVLGVAVLLVACGGTPATDGDGDGGDPTAAATATPDSGDGDGGDDGDTGGDGGSADLDRLEELFTPPDSTQLGRFTSEGGVVVTHQSTQSVEQLRAFYEDRIEQSGLEVVGTFDAQGSVQWIFGEEEGTFGGGIALAPGDGGTTVVVTLGQEP